MPQRVGDSGGGVYWPSNTPEIAPWPADISKATQDLRNILDNLTKKIGLPPPDNEMTKKEIDDFWDAIKAFRTACDKHKAAGDLSGPQQALVEAANKELIEAEAIILKDRDNPQRDFTAGVRFALQLAVRLLIGPA